jgi:alginate O-acetyltransferase complex protein AlgI
MLFPTVEYALFFMTVLVVAWLLAAYPNVHKNFLLLASYFFYGVWNWHYLPLLIGISLASALIARQIQAAEHIVHRKRLLQIYRLRLPDSPQHLVESRPHSEC